MESQPQILNSGIILKAFTMLLFTCYKVRFSHDKGHNSGLYDRTSLLSINFCFLLHVVTR